MPQLPINMTGIQPRQGGYDFPLGEYLFRIDDVQMGMTKDGGKQRINVKCTVVQGPGTCVDHTGKSLNHGFNVDETGLGFFKGFLQVIDYDDAALAQTGGVPQSELMISKQFAGDVIKKENFTNIINAKHASEFLSGSKAAQPVPSILGNPNGQQQQQQYAPQQFSQTQPAAFAQPMQQQQPWQQQTVQQPQPAQLQMPPPGQAAPPQQQQQLPPAVSQPMPGEQPGQFPSPPPPPGTVSGQGQ